MKDVTAVQITNIGPFESADLDLSGADVHLLLGANGIGKSTLLRAIAIPFGVKVAGLKNEAEMRAVVRSGAGSGGIDLILVGDDGKEKALPWAPGKKVAPKTIRKVFGADPKDLEPALEPGSLLAMTPDARRKLFARALGKTLEEKDFLDAGLTLDEQQPVREAGVLRGAPAAIRKSEQIRRLCQSELTGLGTGRPANEALDLPDGSKIRLADLVVDDLAQLIREDDDQIERAAKASGASDAVLEQARRNVEAAEKDTNGLDITPHTDAYKAAIRRAAEASNAKEEVENEVNRLAEEDSRFANEIADLDRAATLARNSGGLGCDGRFKGAENPICPRGEEFFAGLEEKRANLDAKATSAGRARIALLPTLDELTTIATEATEEATSVGMKIEVVKGLFEKLEDAEETLAQVEDEREELSQTGETVDVEALRAHREFLDGLRVKASAYWQAERSFADKDERRTELTQLVERFTQGEEALKAMVESAAGDPVDVVTAKVREISKLVLDEEVEVGSDWSVYYGARPIGLASKAQKAVIDLALRAALSELCGFPILLVDDLDAMDDALRATIVLDGLDALRGRFVKIVGACHAIDPAPNPDLAKSFPWIRRHVITADRQIVNLDA